MYKTIKIGTNDYKLEYSIEASLYSDCIDKVSGMLVNVVMGQSEKDLKPIISAMSDVPNTAITVFYAGLLEHHGAEGDGTVLNRDAAKRLAVVLLKDDSNDIKNWYDLLVLCMNQMGDDGFFDLVGMNEMLQTEAESPKRKATRKKTTIKVSEE